MNVDWRSELSTRTTVSAVAVDEGADDQRASNVTGTPAGTPSDSQSGKEGRLPAQALFI
jgi:hypothetical protein